VGGSRCLATVAFVPYYLVYVSAAKRLLSASELDEMLTSFRAKNAALSITGALLYGEGNFIQVIEGERDTVEDLFGVIVEDPRHTQVLVLLRGRTSEPQFVDWSMAFRDVTGDDSVLAKGYREFFDDLERDAGSVAVDPTVAQRLLMSFRRSLSRAVPGPGSTGTW
jgi:hypothetical protein